jgi:hypothetical protein
VQAAKSGVKQAIVVHTTGFTFAVVVAVLEVVVATTGVVVATGAVVLATISVVVASGSTWGVVVAGGVPVSRVGVGSMPRRLSRRWK